MKKLLFTICFPILLLACNSHNSSNKKNDTISNEIQDDSKIATRKPTEKEIQDRINEIFKEKLTDTTGVGSSPIKVLRSRLIKREYSSYKDIAIDFKNVSNKNVTAIRFEWYGENAFGEPADMGGIAIEGRGGGFTDDKVRAGKSNTCEWEIMSKDAKKIIMARAREVVFEDGTKWTLELK